MLHLYPNVTIPGTWTARSAEKSVTHLRISRLDNDLPAEQVLQARKGQTAIETRFEQLKTVHETAPELLKNPGRIEAFFTMYFFAFLARALIKRELRLAVQRGRAEALPTYPEERRRAESVKCAATCWRRPQRAAGAPCALPARTSRKSATPGMYWNPITVVTLNPERAAVIRAATESIHKIRSAL